MLAPGFVVLSAADQDALGTPGIATVSKEDAWDDGGFALGASAAAAGMLWCDRPYFTGNPTVEWFVERANRGTAAGAWMQCGNELNLELENWQGGPEGYFAFEDAVRAAMAEPERLLAQPPSPGVDGWQQWVRREGHHCCHAYGDFEGMRSTTQWFLDNTSGDVYVTEMNWGAGNTVDVDAWANGDLVQYLDWAAGHERVKMAAFFAWKWNESANLPTSVDAVGTAVERVIRDWVPPANGGASVLEGADVSNWQREVDWARLAASGRTFAIVKACEDPAYHDPWFAGNWRGIKAAGMTRGAYCFARPSVSTPEASVALLAEQLDAVGGLEQGDLIALDLEDTDVEPRANLSDWAVSWLELAEVTFRVKPWVYSGVWYLGPHGLDDERLGAYPLWLAHYRDTLPASPAPWTTVTCWQYESTGEAPGIAGDADLNRFLGGPEELAALGYGGAAPAYDVDAARDRLWLEGAALVENGWPWFGTAVQAAVAQSKKEQ